MTGPGDQSVGSALADHSYPLQNGLILACLFILVVMQARVYFVVLHISSSMFKTNSIYNSTELHNIHYCVRVPPNRQINQEYVNHKIQQNKINNNNNIA